MKHTIYTKCPICGKEQYIILNDDQYDRYIRWQNHELLIQEAFPEVDSSTREKLITGICKECWDDMFDEEDE